MSMCKCVVQGNVLVLYLVSQVYRDFIITKVVSKVNRDLCILLLLFCGALEDFLFL
jgi:hypothetical protein